MADQPESIFEKNQETPETKPNAEAQGIPPSAPEPFADLLSSIVNERGEPKYKSLEDALVGLKNAQEYIPQIKSKASQAEQRIEELERENERLIALEKTVLELTEQKGKTETNGVTLSEEDVAKMVEQSIQRTQTIAKQKENISTVISQLEAKFGKEAERVFYTKATEMGLSMKEMNELAAKSPVGVLTLLGINGSVAPKQTQANPFQSTVDTTKFQPSAESYIGREEKSLLLGATQEEILEGVKRAEGLVAELETKGMTIQDMANPKVFFKNFNKRD